MRNNTVLENAVALLPQSTPTWLHNLNKRGKASWLAASFPTRKTEDWKYTSLRVLESGDYFSSLDTSVTAEALEQYYTIDGLDSLKLVFVNGTYSKALSSTAQELGEQAGLRIISFDDADDAQAQQIQSLLGSTIRSDKHLFTALNESQLENGLFIHVDENVQIKKKIQIVCLSLKQEQEFSLYPRVFIHLEEGAQACIVEQFSSDEPSQNAFVNAVTELKLSARARLDYYRINDEQEHINHIGGVHATLDTAAHLDAFYFGLGGRLKRIDAVVNYVGQRASCNLNGLYLPCNNQHIDYHTCIEHAVPHCTTNEVFRGIIGDSAKAVFNGRIHIHKDAQKTLASLSNKNLLTSKKAEIDTKPELEIYADDVQCAHGATVAQLDEQSLHYMRTRGVSEQTARTLLSFGFINELVSGIEHEAIANYIRPKTLATFSAHTFIEFPEVASTL